MDKQFFFNFRCRPSLKPVDKAFSTLLVSRIYRSSTSVDISLNSLDCQYSPGSGWTRLVMLANADGLLVLVFLAQ